MYPSLESDEEDLANKAKLKRKKNWEDTPWSPKGNHSDKQIGLNWLFICNDYYFFFAARVMPTLPKQDRPAREGARVASVETGLAAAAAKLAQQVNVEKKVFLLL